MCIRDSIDATQSNDIILAARNEKDIYAAADRIEALKGNTALGMVKTRLRKKIIGEVEGWEDAVVLTDDRAPVEMAWDLMALEYAR